MHASSYKEKLEVPNQSYIDFIGESPYAQKISSLFKNNSISIKEEFQFDLDPNDWRDKFQEGKEDFYSKIDAERQVNKDELWNFLQASTDHAIKNFSAKLKDDEYLAKRLLIKFDTPSINTREKPRWHFDHRKAHVICNLVGEHFTLYRGPASCGEAFTQFYALKKYELPEGKIIEAPLGKYIFSTQATKPVCHSLPYKNQVLGRIVIALFAGDHQWILEDTSHICAD